MLRRKCNGSSARFLTPLDLDDNGSSIWVGNKTKFVQSMGGLEGFGQALGSHYAIYQTIFRIEFTVDQVHYLMSISPQQVRANKDA